MQWINYNCLNSLRFDNQNISYCKWYKFKIKDNILDGRTTNNERWPAWFYGKVVSNVEDKWSRRAYCPIWNDRREWTGVPTQKLHRVISTDDIVRKYFKLRVYTKPRVYTMRRKMISEQHHQQQRKQIHVMYPKKVL